MKFCSSSTYESPKILNRIIKIHSLKLSLSSNLFLQRKSSNWSSSSSNMEILQIINWDLFTCLEFFCAFKTYKNVEFSQIWLEFILILFDFLWFEMFQTFSSLHRFGQKLPLAHSFFSLPPQPRCILSFQPWPASPAQPGQPSDNGALLFYRCHHLDCSSTTVPLSLIEGSFGNPNSRRYSGPIPEKRAYEEGSPGKPALAFGSPSSGVVET